MTINRMTVTVRATDSWMVKALAKQIHTMKWNGRAPGVIVKPRKIGMQQALNNVSKALNEAWKNAYYGTERTVL